MGLRFSFSTSRDRFHKIILGMISVIAEAFLAVDRMRVEMGLSLKER